MPIGTILAAWAIAILGLGVATLIATWAIAVLISMAGESDRP